MYEKNGICKKNGDGSVISRETEVTSSFFYLQNVLKLPHLFERTLIQSQPNLHCSNRAEFNETEIFSNFWETDK